jgi:hypothetical protein
MFISFETIESFYVNDNKIDINFDEENSLHNILCENGQWFVKNIYFTIESKEEIDTYFSDYCFVDKIIINEKILLGITICNSTLNTEEIINYIKPVIDTQFDIKNESDKFHINNNTIISNPFDDIDIDFYILSKNCLLYTSEEVYYYCYIEAYKNYIK